MALVALPWLAIRSWWTDILRSYTTDPNTPYNNTYTLNQSTLRAYNADTGAPIWPSINQNAAPLNLGPTNIVTANNRVFVVRHKGIIMTPAGPGNCIVQAYQVATPNLVSHAIVIGIIISLAEALGAGLLVRPFLVGVG